MRLVEPGPPKVSLDQGFSYIKKGDLGKAIAVMDELILEDPYFAQAYWARALCYEYLAVGADDMERAISDYTKSIVYSIDPPAFSYGHRGILYFKSGMLTEALNDLNKALATNLFWAEAHFYRGRIYLALLRDKSDLLLSEDDFCEAIKYSDEPFAPAYFWRAQTRRLLNKMEEAVADYRQAVEIDPGDVLALNALAYCNEHGIGVKVDRRCAEELYKQAAEQGFTAAQKNLAWFYGGDGSGNCEDAESSAYWMRKAALDGDCEAQNLYGLRLLYGKGVRRDVLQAAHYFKLAARENYVPAMCNLADCYEQGLGVAEDVCRAFGLYEEAAKLGSTLARYNIGRYYYFGIGIDEDNDKAFSALKPLADEGYARAQDIVGMCYENGFGTATNQKLAGKYYRAAWDQGYAQAGVHLAARFSSGRGVRKNLATAIRFYEEAGKRGLSYAYFALGKLYFADKCDYAKAAEAFKRAVNLGEKNASVWLARSLMHLKDAEIHVEEIYKLLLKAVNEEDDKLHAAIFLFDFECYGVFGFKPESCDTVKRIENLVLKAGKNQAGLSCAQYCIAQAYEFGLGVERDENEAARLYLMAGNSAEPGGCRCFIAGFAHMLYQGIGCDADIKAADDMVSEEMERPASNETKLLYIWSRIRDGQPEDTGPLVKIAEKIIREEPWDPVGAYTMYYFKREGNAGKYLSRLKKTLKYASPYLSFMIESHMREKPGEPLYPMLTAEIVDKYEKSAAG